MTTISQFSSTQEFLQSGTVLDSPPRPAPPAVKNQIHVPNPVPELTEPKQLGHVSNSPIGRLRKAVAESRADKSTIFGRTARLEQAVAAASRLVLEEPSEGNLARFVAAKRELVDADLPPEIFEGLKRSYRARVLARTREPLIEVLREWINVLQGQRESVLAAFRAISADSTPESEKGDLQLLEKSQKMAGLNAELRGTIGTLSRIASSGVTYADIMSGIARVEHLL